MCVNYPQFKIMYVMKLGAKVSFNDVIIDLIFDDEILKLFVKSLRSKIKLCVLYSKS